MKKSLTKRYRKYWDRFPDNQYIPEKGEVWLVKYPYEVRGNMEKLRPAIVSQVNGETFICRKITTNSKRGKEIKGNLAKILEKPSYKTNIYQELTIDKFYKRIYKWENKNERT